MSVLYYLGNKNHDEGSTQKVYITPPQDVILSLLRETKNFPLLETSALAHPEMPSSVISPELIKQLKLKPSLKKRIKVTDGEVEQDMYTLTLRTYGENKTEINVNAIPAVMDIKKYQLILGKDFYPQKTSNKKASEEGAYQYIYQQCVPAIVEQ